MAIVIILVMFFIVGIVLLNLKPAENDEQARKSFLKDLAEVMESKLVPLAAYDDSYSISFTYKDLQFVYEDIVSDVGQKRLHRSFLRLQTPSQLSLSFNERANESEFNKDIVGGLLKTAEKARPEQSKLDLPKLFEQFNVITDDINATNTFLNDRKVLRIIKEFKNTDTRGWANMAIRLKDGEIILSFSTQPGHNPSLSQLRNDPHILEDYAKRLFVLAQILNSPL